MTLCLVTDRRRLRPDASDESSRACLVEQVRHAIDAGIDLVQVREPNLPAAQLAGLVGELVRLREGSRTRIVVNDRLDVALACKADGVHLRGDSMPARAVRSIAPPGFLVGRSVHGVEEAVAAGPVDYLIAGTTFGTPSKAGATLLGAEGLARIVQAAAVPVLAIGGVTIERVASVAATGAGGLAAIGLFVGSESNGSSCRPIPLQARVARVRASFDTPTPHS